MLHIESPRHRVLEPLPALHQIRIRRLNEQMVMIVHQYPGMNTPPRFFTNLGQTFQKNRRSSSSKKIDPRRFPRAITW